MTTIKRKRAAGFLLLSAAAAGVLVIGAVSGLVPGTPSAQAKDDAAKDVTSSCSIKYGALDATQTKANPDKVSPEDLGPRVNAKTVAEAEAELKERRTCGADMKFDTELLATQYADWSAEGLTSRKVSFSDVDGFRHQLNNDTNLYKSTLDEIEGLEGNSETVASITTVPVGVWSVYALPDGKGDLTTHIGRTGSVGTALTFTYKGKTIKYRLECGFQIVREVQMPGLPACDYANCGPKPAAPPTTHVTTCQERGDCVTTNTPTPCKPGWSGTYEPNCKAPASEDPYAQGHATTGGGRNADPGPGTYETQQQANTQQPGSTPRSNPAAPAAPAASAPPVVTPKPSSSAPSTPVDTGNQGTNNGTVPTDGSTGAACNPTFQDNC